MASVVNEKEVSLAFNSIMVESKGEKWHGKTKLVLPTVR